MEEKREKTAFIFLGNSTGNAFDVGVSKVLFKKIKPNVVLASSMGSVNASFILKDSNFIKNIEELERLWKSFDAKKIFRLNPEIFYKFIFANSLFKNEGMKHVFSEILGFKDRKIESCSVPLYIAAYDNTNKTTVFFNRGSLLDALMASCAAPLYFPPYKIGNTEYLDGAINNRACLDKAIELGCKKIFLINVSSRKPTGKSLISLLKRNIGLMKNASIEHFLSSKLSKILVNISPDQEQLPLSFTDTSKIESLIKHGEEKARDVLKNLKI